MTNAPQSNNDHTRKDALARAHARTTATTAGAPLRAQETSGVRGVRKVVKRVSFNGRLTNRLLTALPSEDLARLLPHLVPVSVAGGETIYALGEVIQNVYFPESAVVSHLHFMEDGSMTAATIVGREGLVGLSTIFDAPPPSYWTQVTIGGSALRVEREVIKREFARGGAMQRVLLGYTSTRLAQLSQRAVCNGRHRLDERLCTWLLMIHDRAGEEHLPLTHEAMAHHLGARRAGVTTSCNALRDGGAINYHRGVIQILDRRRLEAAACECYRTLGLAVENPINKR